jgi:hypothetical protein
LSRRSGKAIRALLGCESPTPLFGWESTSSAGRSGMFFPIIHARWISPMNAIPQANVRHRLFWRPPGLDIC